MTAASRLLIRADDLGSFRGANRAIDQLLRGGLCRNAGIMAPTPYFDEAAMLMAGRRGVCLGLHATLNAEWDTFRWRPVLPAARVPCLVEPDGSFKRNPKLLHDDGANFEQMLAEITAQLAKAREAGLEIAYLDQHMCFGWVHEPGHPEQRFESVLSDFAKREGLRYFGSETTPEGQVSVVNGQRLQPYKASRPGALAEAAAIGGAWLWIAHPAMRDPETAIATHAGLTPGQVAEARDAEWRTLAGPQLAATCKRLGIQPIGVTDL